MPRKIDLYTMGLPLPEVGILDKDGFPFHHVTNKSLAPVHRQRLEEHGIIVGGGRFTEDEDAVVRANWKAFRKEHGLSHHELLHIIGSGDGTGYINREKTDFRTRTDFWPRMCAGLLSRPAIVVRMRIVYLFDPFPDNKTFTEEEDLWLLQLSKRYSYVNIAELMHKSVRAVLSKLRNRESRSMFSRSERRRLWNTVVFTSTELFDEVDEYKFPSSSKIDWNHISRALSRSKEVLKKEWNVMVEELVQLQKGGTTFFDALETVAPECLNISAAEMSEFIEIVLETSPNLESLLLRGYRTMISKTMKERGLTGFRTGRFSEFFFCRLRLGRMISALRRRLLRPASLRLSLSTQLQLISRCLRSLPSAQERRRFQLRRYHVIKKLESLLSTDDTSWKLSGKLRKYIEQEENEGTQK